MARHRCWAGSTSLDTIARAALREPVPWVASVRSRTVANVDSSSLMRLPPRLDLSIVLHTPLNETDTAGSPAGMAGVAGGRCGAIYPAAGTPVLVAGPDGVVRRAVSAG